VNAQNADAVLKGEIERVREVSKRDYAQRLAFPAGTPLSVTESGLVLLFVLVLVAIADI
jgi:hypothetical protein